MCKTLANLASLANWRPNAKVIANKLLTGLQTYLLTANFFPFRKSP